MRDIFVRNVNNPLITPTMISVSTGYQVIGAFNPGVAKYQGKVHMLVRVAITPDFQSDTTQQLEPHMTSLRYSEADDRIVHEHFAQAELDDYEARTFHYKGQLYLTSISVFYLAVIEEDGSIKISEVPVLQPESQLEEFGIEDPRITEIDGRYYITYVAVSRHGHSTGLITTDDFISYDRQGVILAPNNKDAVFFPETIKGEHYMIHRPSAEGVPAPEIWLARSSDGNLQRWGSHSFLMTPEAIWEQGRIGAGAPPLRTELGWLMFYHGATKTNCYSLGAVLLDQKDPSRVLWRNGPRQDALAEPAANYETEGFFSNVIFVTGAIQDGRELHLYYGAADQMICSMHCDIDDLLDTIRQDMTGT